MKKIVCLTLVALITITAFAQKYGNYLDSNVGKLLNPDTRGLIHFRDCELLYDFDTAEPKAGIKALNSTISISDEFYMSKSKSLLWNSRTDASLTFQAGLKLQKKYYKNKNNLSMGIFQFKAPAKGNQKIFQLKCTGKNNEKLLNQKIYLRRKGWNLVKLKLPAKYVKNIRISQLSGASGKLLIDNVMLSQDNIGGGFMSYCLTSPNTPKENVDKYPLKPLTDAERKAFALISKRVMRTVKKKKVSEADMKKFRDFYKYWDIEIRGDMANGRYLLYYTRKVQGNKNSDRGENAQMYDDNENFCRMLRIIGRAYAGASGTQKEELGNIMVGLVKLVVTYGSIPNPWYNGRGFADGVFYAREALEKAGILDAVSKQLLEQYSINEILYKEHDIVKPPKRAKHGSEFSWQSTADNLDTTSKSNMLLLLLAKDSPQKARTFRRFKSWLDKIALAYAPYDQGTLKPDGSWFHHWGNRFDNYGWDSAWRGTCDYVYWLSRTPFAVSRETHERITHMSKIHFQVMNKLGYSGAMDNLNHINPEPFLTLARAGTTDGRQNIDPLMASYYLTHMDKKGRYYRYKKPYVLKFEKLGIKPAQKLDNNVTLSYAGINIHTRNPYQLYVHGISSFTYNTQYVRPGWLFYDIGGLTVAQAGNASGFLAEYGKSLTNSPRGAQALTPGYNLSRAPAVTSMPSDYKKLLQFYYQKGTDMFVGGLSTKSGNGIFTQVFEADKNKKYKNTGAAGLKFKKTYFMFGDTIVLLGSDISCKKRKDIETGLMQKSAEANILTLSNSSDTSKNMDIKFSSNKVNWMFNKEQNTGVYIMPNQNWRLFKGKQTFGDSAGDIVSAYLEHGKKNWYEWVMLLNSNQDTVKKFATAMKSSKPPVKVLKRDSSAHIVRNGNNTGYVIFKANPKLSGTGLIEKVNSPCVIMLQEKGEELIVNVANPDLNFDNRKPSCSRWSRPYFVTINLKGKFYGVEKLPDNIILKNKGKTTQLKFLVKDGLTSEITLTSDNNNKAGLEIESARNKKEKLMLKKMMYTAGIAMLTVNTFAAENLANKDNTKTSQKQN